MEKQTFTDRLDSLLADRGWSKKDLERESGIKYHRLNEWWRKQTVAKAGDLEVLVDLFGVSQRFLLSGEVSEERLDAISRLKAKVDRLDLNDVPAADQYIDFVLSQRARREDG